MPLQSTQVENIRAYFLGNGREVVVLGTRWNVD